MNGNINSIKIQSILNYFENILLGETVNTANYFEWNTFRVFETMESYVILNPNFKIDPVDKTPLGTAKSGVEDILIKFNEFTLLIECSLRTGASQLDYEAESVVRHLKNHKTEYAEKSFTLFIAPSIDIDFTMMVGKNKKKYPVLPLTIKQFKKLVQLVNTEQYPKNLLNLCENLLRFDLDSKSAGEWLKYIDSQL